MKTSAHACMALLAISLLTACSGGGQSESTSNKNTNSSQESGEGRADGGEDLLITVDPVKVTFSVEGLYPEGVHYDPTEKVYYVTSLTQGTIGKVDDKGNYQAFTDGEGVISAIGVYVDRPRNRVLLACADPGPSPKSTPDTQGKTAKLAVYNLETGAREQLIDLAALSVGTGAHFANDIAVDSAGNVYVTNSYSPIIYKVDPQYQASVLLEADDFKPASGAFGLNGIVYHPNNLLLVAKDNGKTLFRVDLNQPSAFKAVQIDAELPPGADGLEWMANGKLAVAFNTGKQVLLLSGNGDWTAAEVEGKFNTPNVFPTTIASRGDGAYVLYAQLGRLFAGDASVKEYTLQSINFQ